MNTAEKIKSLCLVRDFQIAVAESLTVGQLQSQIASVSGASAYFAGGITTYLLAQKVERLGVDEESARRDNCVSTEVAIQMAAGTRQFFFANSKIPPHKRWGIATTGYAEPSPNNGVICPMAHLAVTNGYLTRSVKLEAPEGLDRVGAQKFFSEEALKLFLKQTAKVVFLDYSGTLDTLPDPQGYLRRLMEEGWLVYIWTGSLNLVLGNVPILMKPSNPFDEVEGMPWVERVVIVDDERDNRTLLNRIARVRGFPFEVQILEPEALQTFWK